MDCKTSNNYKTIAKRKLRSSISQRKQKRHESEGNTLNMVLLSNWSTYSAPVYITTAGFFFRNSFYQVTRN